MSPYAFQLIAYSINDTFKRKNNTLVDPFEEIATYFFVIPFIIDLLLMLDMT